jgi:hypothetical protein
MLKSLTSGDYIQNPGLGQVETVLPNWNSPGFIDTQRSLFEARSNASGLTTPR